MGMFDWYEPRPHLTCPFCTAELSGWQGSDAENALFVWRQGEPHPVDQRADLDARIADNERIRFELPETFHIATACPNDGQPLRATGRCRSGVWAETTPGW
jgi:hypothetical protein